MPGLMVGACGGYAAWRAAKPFPEACEMRGE